MLRRSQLNRFSDKKIRQMWEELPIREELAKRCGGVYVSHKLLTHLNGKEVEIPIGYCKGGACEICDKKGGTLHPHERIFRSHMGKLSLENSDMACYHCHAPKHGIKVVNSKPQWGNYGHSR